MKGQSGNGPYSSKSTYSKAQVAALFQENAVLLGRTDYVPFYRAEVLFGKPAVAYARQVGFDEKAPLSYSRAWWGPDDDSESILALTYRGFQTAAHYYNCCQMQKEAKGYGG